MLRPLIPALVLATPALAEAPVVVTDIPPVQGLVASVMGELGNPALLVPAGTSPHQFSLKPSDARALQEAGLVFWVGEALTPGIGRSIDAVAEGATVIELSEVPGTEHLESRENAIFSDGEDHDHAHEGDDHDGEEHAEEAHDEHGHNHEGGDPHMWLSPDNARVWLGAIADALAEADPANAETYKSNAAGAEEALDASVEVALSLLEPVRDMEFVVFHDAYQYYEHDFGLHVLGALQVSDATAPSPARLDALRDAIAESGAACVFAEPQFDPRLIAAVTGEDGVNVAELDPLGTSLPLGPDFYPTLITDIAGRIARCAE